MGGSALKVAPQINLDEFERRLRAAGSSPGGPEDPLDELARLVGSDAPASVSFDKAPKIESPRAPQLRLPHVDDAPAPSTSVRGALHEVHAKAQAESIEDAPLRGAIGDDHAVSPAETAAQSEEDYSEPLLGEGVGAPEMALAARRSRRVPLTLGLLVGVGAVGLVGAWAIKGAPGLPRTPPVIMAAEGPTKVQPPSQDTVASPSDSASILMKDQAGKPGPVKLVSSEEQPVDLQQQTHMQTATRSIAPISADASSSSNAQTPAAASPVAPSSQTPAAALTTVGPTTAPPAAPAAAFPEPKRVKTVSVRPDGSVISTGAAPAADAPTAAAASEDGVPTPQPANPPVPRARPSFGSSANNAAAQPATPKLDLPAKPSAKSTARVPIAKIDTTVAAADGQSPEAPAAAPAPTPLQIVPSLLEKAVKAVGNQQPPAKQVAAADPTATATTPESSGGYAVQLAAPGTEREAQSASARLQAKYGAELGGAQLSIRQADHDGKTVYRVRAGNLSKADAVALCQKLKASGGDSACFIAKN